MTNITLCVENITARSLDLNVFCNSCSHRAHTAASDDHSHLCIQIVKQYDMHQGSFLISSTGRSEQLLTHAHILQLGGWCSFHPAASIITIVFMKLGMSESCFVLIFYCISTVSGNIRIWVITSFIYSSLIWRQNLWAGDKRLISEMVCCF